MISEILDIFANLNNLPNKEKKSDNSKNTIVIFICYFVSAISIIFLIPEFKEISNNKNSLLNISLVVVGSIVLALIGFKLIKEVIKFEQLTFSNFLTIIISLILLFMFLECSIINKYFYPF